MLLLCLILSLLTPAALLDAQSHNMDIYWIDVEGGATTLIVSPTGESMLIIPGSKSPSPSSRAGDLGGAKVSRSPRQGAVVDQ
jgi:hypothetical protein